MNAIAQECRRSVAPWAWVVALVTVLCFARVATHEFTPWDDQQTIAANPALLPPTISGIASYWRLLETGDAATGRVVNHQYGLWIPLTYTVWGALASVAQVPDPSAASGIALNPYVFHSASVALHATTATTVFFLLLRLTGHRTGSGLGALLFALHPLQVEAVAWASGKKDLLAGAFGILALLLYVRMAQANDAPLRQKRRDWWLATIAFVAAMLSKPPAIMIPVLAITLDLLLLRRKLRTVLSGVLAWLVIAIPFAVIAKVAQPPVEISPTPLWARPFIATDAVAFYVGKLIWPVGLTIDYGRTPASVISSGAWKWTWVVPLAVTIATFLARRRGFGFAPTAWVLFVAAPLQVLGLTPFLFQFYSTTADHYLYVAMLGPALLVVAWIARAPRALWLVAPAVLICGASTIRQCGVWRDAETLFTHALSVRPDSFAALNNLGTLRGQQNRPKDAERLFRRAVELAPMGLQALKNHRETLTVLGRAREALDALRQETRVRRSLPYAAAGPYWNDPNHLGVLLLLSGKVTDAERHFVALRTLDPSNHAAALLLDLTIMLRQSPATQPATSPAVAPSLDLLNRGVARAGDKEQPAK
jgi:hypothetical protein